MHVAISGQGFGQSGTAGASGGQHGMWSGIAEMAAGAIAAPLTGVVIGPATSPRIATIRSSPRNQALIFMRRNMSQMRCTGKERSGRVR